jgi:hypothetical protein
MSHPFDRDDLARIAFDLSPFGMLAVDERGAVVAANREVERLFGWRREELLGQSVEVLVPERFRGVHPAHRAAFLADPASRPMGAGRELYGRRRDGVEFPVEIGLNPVATARGRFVLASAVDISARRKIEEDLRRSQRLETIGILAGGIAHDFNNILLGIVGHTELVLREAGGSRQTREDLEQVLKAADRGRLLVQRILTFSRETKAARLSLRLESTLHEVVQLLRASLPSTVEIRTEVAADVPVVLADETQIHQVLMNLATNAAQAMPAGGAIEIRLSRLEVHPDRAQPRLKPGTHARLTVTDTGAGMPPEVLEHALEPFFTTKPPGQGTGLGLSVVHGIVTAHGGSMEIASQPGLGTSVTIDLPAASGEGAPPAGAAQEEHGARRLRVLFVEDDQVLAGMQRRQLEHLGFEVTAHTSSLEALEAFRARPDAFDLLVTDDTMPRMTGSALAREILAIRPGLPVLMVSGGDRTEPGKERPPGVGRVLRKPHTARELERAIREVLGERP